MTRLIVLSVMDGAELVLIGLVCNNRLNSTGGGSGPVCAVNSSVCVAVHRWMRRCIKKHKLQLTSFFATSADEADLQAADAAKLDLSAVPVSLHRIPR